MEMMADDEEGSVVTVVTSAVSCVEPADFRQVEDEVDHEEEVDEVDELMEVEGQSGDYQFGGNHPMRVGSRLSKRFNGILRLDKM